MIGGEGDEARLLGDGPGGPAGGMAGGRRRRRGKSSKRKGSKRRYRSRRGGDGVLATAAVPLGLLALQRYFKGSRSTRRGVHNMGNTFKRTFRRRR